MYTPNYNPFLNNTQCFPNPRSQRNTNNGRGYYTPRFYNNRQFSQAYGDHLGTQRHNNEYWCETCDRAFTTEILLDNHKKQHQKCNIDGCQFIAHPKVITKHIQMQHSTGLYKKIAKLNNPEEIEKWREERRKKYPTKSNIEKKNLELQEKIERGEKMGIKLPRNNQDSHRSGHMFGNKHARKENQISKKKNQSHPRRQLLPRKVVKFDTDIDIRRLKPFTGIQQLIADPSQDEPSSPETIKDLIEDDEFVDDSRIILKNEPVICGALVSLLNDYGSSDDEDLSTSASLQNCKLINNTKGNKITKNNECVIKNKIKSHENCTVQPGDSPMQCDVKLNHEDEDSGPEEVKVVKEIANPSTVNNIAYKKTHTIKNRQEKVKKCENGTNFKRKLPSTLLEKLLSSEIQHERNVVLQCIRYIVKNNYLNQNNKHEN